MRLLHSPLRTPSSPRKQNSQFSQLSHKKKPQMAKSKTYNKLIHTRRWLMLRRRKLTEDPLCERCLKEGRYTQATEIHHVMPVEDALSPWGQEQLMYDYHNLQALCHRCHVAVHTEMGRSGKQQNQRKTERQKDDFRKRFME